MDDETKKRKNKFSFLANLGMVSKSKTEPTIHNDVNAIKKRKKKLEMIDKELN